MQGNPSKQQYEKKDYNNEAIRIMLQVIQLYVPSVWLSLFAYTETSI